MAEEILKKIPDETKWAITGQTFTAAYTAITALVQDVVGKEKLTELNNMVYGPGAKISFPQIKEAFNIPVEDAIGAHTLLVVVSYLQMGPEFEGEFVEKTPERVVYRTTKCPWMERYKEQGLNLDTIVCPEGHQKWGEEGLKAIDPRLTHKLTKTMPEKAPYCEYVIEFKK